MNASKKIISVRLLLFMALLLVVGGIAYVLFYRQSMANSETNTAMPSDAPNYRSPMVLSCTPTSIDFGVLNQDVNFYNFHVNYDNYGCIERSSIYFTATNTSVYYYWLMRSSRMYKLVCNEWFEMLTGSTGSSGDNMRPGHCITLGWSRHPAYLHNIVGSSVVLMMRTKIRTDGYRGRFLPDAEPIRVPVIMVIEPCSVIILQLVPGSADTWQKTYRLFANN